MIYTFVDFETTGLDPKKHQVIEIAAIKTDLIEDYGLFHTMVRLNPENQIEEEAFSVNGITEEQLRHGMHEKDALEALYSFIGDSIMVAHSATFEMAFLNRIHREPTSFACTRTMSLLVEPKESAKLENIAKRYNIWSMGMHRALIDVDITISVFKILKEKCHALDISYINTMIEFPDRPLMYVPSYAKVVEGEK
jgi:DNA polymerase-3 subunit epsilon